MKNKSTVNKTTIIKPTKATKNRITALILALLLTATVLIPQIPVKAEETTTGNADISENNGSGGTSAGAGDNLPIDTEDNSTITTNTDGTRILRLSYFHSYTADKKSVVYKHTYYITLEGKIVARSCITNGMSDTGSTGCERVIYLFSDKPFTYNGTCVITMDGSITQTIDYKERSANKQDNFYYCSLASVLYTDKEDESHNVGGFMNPYNFTTYYGEDGWSNRFNVITKDLDLSKDDYKVPDETSAVYNKNLDFASISADYKVKYTIEKNKEGHFEFITPDDAGIQFDWSNRMDIDGAYVKFNLYGEYYDSFWSTTYTNTYVTLTCDRKNDLTYLCKQKDMLAQAKEKCNGSKGYGFVVNYIYVQAFANIDGTLCRSRIYKFNSDLVSDYGNADKENDEWVPEITGGDPMPDDYEPDPENPDPEKTEPEPDKDDDTVVDTPIKYDPDVVINDDVAYLEAFKQFINVMKQGISYLGDFPLLVSKVFSYIPPIFLLFIGVGFAVALLLRFLGR